MNYELFQTDFPLPVQLKRADRASVWERGLKVSLCIDRKWPGLNAKV